MPTHRIVETPGLHDSNETVSDYSSTGEPHTVLESEKWVRSIDRMTEEEYQHAIDGFISTSTFNPTRWANDTASADMKYAALTVKYHDESCLFDSKLTKYSIMFNGFGFDIAAEFVNAFRARGVKVGFYYSLLDWNHPDYPVYGDPFHPQRDNPQQDEPTRDLERCLKYMHEQLEELCSNYGQLDILWLNISYDKMLSKTWRAVELVSKIRKLQPGIIIDNRDNRLETRLGLLHSQ